MEFRDLKAQYNRYQTEIDSAVKRVLTNGVFIGGTEVMALEEQLADYVGTRHCITCANGTEAMTLVLMAWGIGPGDAVFVPDFTFFSTGEVVSFLGATPVFVDVEWDTFNMDPAKLAAAIDKIKKEGRLTPKAVIPVDLFGLPANHPAIAAVAAEHSLLILEDAAQGFGGSLHGQKVGSFGHAATTSFFPAKPLGCYGDGGAIFTNDDGLAQLLHSLKVHGKGENKYDNIRIGVNSRLDTLQAAILQIKLKAFIDHELEDVNRVADWYNEGLEGLGHLLETPVIPEGYQSSYAQYTIKLKINQRNVLQTKLKEARIPSMVYYQKPMHQQQAFEALKINKETQNEFLVTNQLCDAVLSLPVHPYLRFEDVKRVDDTLALLEKEISNEK